MVATQRRTITAQTDIGAVMLSSYQDYYSIYLDGAFFPNNLGDGRGAYVFARVQRRTAGVWNTIETGGMWVYNKNASIRFDNYAVNGSAMRVQVDVYPGRWVNWTESWETTGSKRTYSVGLFYR